MILLWVLACGGGAAPPPPAGCRSCHGTVSEAPPDLHGGISCEACHLGEPGAQQAEAAHVGLEREPGALDTLDETCGRAGCHRELAERVLASPMATARGLVAVDRWAFGELAVPDGEQAIGEVLARADPTPAEDHLRRLCGGCHLGTRRDNRDDAVTGTGSGCGACHSASRAEGGPHPPVDAAVPDDRCLGCHSRSGRISLSYQGLAEVRPLSACEVPATLHDGRAGCRVEPDLHHAAGLACTDCHLHTELMGDGRSYAHQEDAVEVRCESCHGPVDETLEGRWGQVDDPVTARILARRGEPPGAEEAVRRGVRGTPLWNLRSSEAGWVLTGKLDGRSRTVPQTPRGADHRLAGHERLSCEACHAAWAPRCPDCHTAWDPAAEQWDFGTASVRPGRWVETAQRFGWGPPALAVTGEDRIVPAVPGMIATLELETTVRTRLFARAAPHTTSRLGRGCGSCHGAPEALGLGPGSLDLGGWPEVSFTPAGPGDGWVELFPVEPGVGTRVGLRSLDAGEQRRMLGVGRCVGCHGEAEDTVYGDFAGSVGRWTKGEAACPGTRRRVEAGSGRLRPQALDPP